MVSIIKTARGGITTYHGEDAGRYRPHVGIDIGHGDMTDDDRRMVAPAAGIVTAAGWDGTYGNRVIITHSDGTWSLIAHMDSLNVNVSEYVQQGQQIGVMGRTGGPWGSIAGWFVHGHQEYHLADGRAANPLDFVGAPAVVDTTPILEEVPAPPIALEFGMAQRMFFARIKADGTDDNEWMMAGPDIGPLNPKGTRLEKLQDGYRVTTDKDVARRWARQYSFGPIGTKAVQLPWDDYVAQQEFARKDAREFRNAFRALVLSASTPE